MKTEVDMETLLLEIGTEEIPAGYIEPALNVMSSMLLQKMTDARIDTKILDLGSRGAS
jgi:glycyl-tRNA synthetase beta chain